MPSTSAPVKGRLVVGATVGLATPALAAPVVPVLGNWLVVPVLAATDGGPDGVTEQLTPVVDPQLGVAPATDGTTINEATANPEPINKPLAHMLVALLSVGGLPPACPFTDHVNRC